VAQRADQGQRLALLVGELLEGAHEVGVLQAAVVLGLLGQAPTRAPSLSDTSRTVRRGSSRRCCAGS
jgi:hypothetical protein